MKYCLLLITLLATCTSLLGDERPNIVLIMADDTGYECLGANGGLDYSTPRLDRMAAEGLRFSHCYSQPICTPSRVKLMTGLSNKRNHFKFGVLGRDQRTFAQVLQQAGYATCIAGKWQLGREKDAPQHFGFEQSLLWQHTRGRMDADKHDTRYPNPHLERDGEPLEYEHGEFSTDLFVDYVCEFIESHRERPFLVYYPMALVHCPFCPTPKSTDWDATSNGSTTYKGDPQYFGDMVAYADRAVGRILDCLQDTGLSENTLVIFLGDNGTDSPIVSNTTSGRVIGAKGKTLDGGNHVPCIMQWPGQVIQPGRTVESIIDFSDFFPSLCEATGVKFEGMTDGVSFLPLFTDPTTSGRSCIYQWYHRDGVPEKAVEFARTTQYKLYSTGEFYSIPSDRLEQNPLTDLTSKQLAIRERLQAEIAKYRDVIPAREQRKRLNNR